MFTCVATDLALEHVYRPFFVSAPQRFVIPALDGRVAKDGPLLADWMAPFLGRKSFDLLSQLASFWRCGQESAYNTEAKLGPAFM